MYVLGKLIWWSVPRHHGIAVELNGTRRFFLHLCHIMSGPEKLEPGQYVRFRVADKPVKPGMLPNAIDATVSVQPFDAAKVGE
jgi:hypothetical protein